MGECGHQTVDQPAELARNTSRQAMASASVSPRRLLLAGAVGPGDGRDADEHRAVHRQLTLTVSFSIQTDWVGVSPDWPPTWTLAIWSTTSRPSTTWPNTE